MESKSEVSAMPSHRNDSSRKPTPAIPRLPKGAIPILALTVLVIVGGMATLETALYWAFPRLTEFESRAVVIAALALASGLAAYLSIVRRSELLRQAAEERAAREQTEAQLEEARRAAAAAQSARIEFLAEISHEIRTPLNGILGMIELALLTPLTTEQKDCLEMVKTSADSLSTVINDVLDYFKIETGSLDLERAEFNLSDCLGDTFQTLALWADQKSLELACHVRSEVPETVVGDPARLQQIVLNLVGNAVKFTEQGDVVLDVALEAQTPESVLLHFALTDTGIPVEKQGLIFQPASQADAPTAFRIERAGFGVTVSSQLVKFLGGRIWVENRSSQGSVFHFTLRFDPPQGPAKRPLPTEAARLRGLPVLVVDDLEANRVILEDLLLRYEMNPVLADGGVAALAALERAKAAGRPFELAIIDAQMPDMNGFVLAQRIQEDPQLARRTLITLGAHVQQRDAARCPELGIAGYLVKPIKQSSVLPAILDALRKPEQSISAVRDIPAVPASQAQDAESHPGRRLRILLAEDNIVNQKLVVRWLERAGHTVVVAVHGRAALDLLKTPAEGKFDLVLMDVKMPEMDGVEATMAIREKEKTTGEHIPIVALTAQAMKGDRERCLQAGMDGYISKPVRIKTLFATLKKFAPQASWPSLSPEKRSEEIVAERQASNRLEGNKRLLADMMKLVRHESRKLLSAMGDAIDRQDAMALEDAARGLEISLSHLTVPARPGNPQDLEKEGGTIDLDRAGEAYLGLAEEFERVRQALAELEKTVKR